MRGEIYLFTDHDQLIGMCTLQYRPNYLLMQHLIILPEFQNRNYGHLILTFADAIALGKGLPEVQYVTAVSQANATAEYLERGFQEFARDEKQIALRKAVSPIVDNGLPV